MNPYAIQQKLWSVQRKTYEASQKIAEIINQADNAGVQCSETIQISRIDLQMIRDQLAILESVSR